jgi:hypothetical protein
VKFTREDDWSVFFSGGFDLTDEPLSGGIHAVAQAGQFLAVGEDAWRAIREKNYFDAVIGGGGMSGSRFASPRAPRTSNSSKSREGATIEAGMPPCAEPNAPRAVPAKPVI